MELLIEHLGHGLMLSLLLSLPLVLLAASIGLIVGILQAVTQVQEQTIAAAPKILGVFTMLLLGGGIMMTLLEGYVRESIQIAFNEIPQDGLFILPAESSMSAGQKRAQAFFRIQAKEGSNSEHLKELTSQWPGIDEKRGGPSVLNWPHTSGNGNALSVSERMKLQQGKR